MSTFPSQASSHPHSGPTFSHRHKPSLNSAPAMSHQSAPAGTFSPGTKVQVGNHRVVVEKYLSEGGFAHVYVVRLPQPVDAVQTAVLKRVAVPDKGALANMRTEVETMKKLRGHRPIVKYIDSHASQLKGGGYEVFLLMEFCAGGGLIDFMNTRLQNRLTEPEVLKIFSDIVEGVACMHYLKPPLLHRDLKVENVLISLSGGSHSYKLCDFGSTAPPRPAATSAAEGRLIEDDVQRHTTLQYRSPEMIDVYRKQPIDEKSDIWALGVLLYKLCYYTTPFEEVGQMAILNASFKYPAYPVFSDKLKMLIASMLRENPEKRPNIYQVCAEACSMQGKPVPIRDIYAGRSRSESRRYQELPPSPTETPKVGAVLSPPVQETTVIPEIAPMRRGRPTRPTSHQNSAKPSPSPMRDASGDPFAALDGGKAKQGNADELSNRFPTLDQFSILHEKGDKFEFEPTVGEAKPTDPALSRRITHALADEVFSRNTPGSAPSAPRGETEATDKKTYPFPEMPSEPTSQSTTIHQPVPQKPNMVSTGTMTSPSPPPSRAPENPALPQRPIYRFPPPEHQRRPSNPTWAPENNEKPPSANQGPSPSQAPSLLKPESPKPTPLSSRPSLEVSRPSTLEVEDTGFRSKSANAKTRPASAIVGSRTEYSRDNSRSPRDPGWSGEHYEDGERLRPRLDSNRDSDRANIHSDVDFLRAKEEEEMERKREKRLSAGPKHTKRSSLSSISLSGTKTLLAGRFGDAFRRFEENPEEKNNLNSSNDHASGLTPITGSEVTELSDDERGVNDSEDISPEMRREFERRRLSKEEKRVANAAAEYRMKLAEKGEGPRRGGGDGAVAAGIQNKVQSLLEENNKPPPIRTATGYGHLTDSGNALQAKQFENPSAQRFSGNPAVTRKPLALDTRDVGPRPPTKDSKDPSRQHQSPSSARSSQRPVAPPKPKSLQTGEHSDPTRQTSKSDNTQSPQGNPTGSREDWEKNFSRRYPSLSGLEMVETEIDIPRHLPTLRTKEV